MLPALAVLAGMALGRVGYPRYLEWRQRRRRPMGEDGVIAGAAPITLHRAGAPAVLVLHGGGDTPQVVAQLGRALHDRGFSVRAPLLAGHGRHLSALQAASAANWHDQVVTEFDQLRRDHSAVAVVGLSMGGALAVSLAAIRPDVASLVLLAPYTTMPPAVRRLADVSTYWEWAVPYFPAMGQASIRDPRAAAAALGHGILTPAMLRALRDVVDAAWQSLPAVRAPTLVIQSREDNRIDPEGAERAFLRLGARRKRFVWTNGAGHVITVDFGHERVFALTAKWLETHRAVSAV